MKTKSIMLIAVSLGFGLIAAIGMSQVLGQKTGDGQPDVEMVQVFVALEPLEIGDELNEENLKVQKRPVTDVPENAITALEELQNMVVIQKIPKDLLIVTDFICDKNEANLRKQPPPGFRAYTLKTALEDTTHNSIQPGDRVDIVGVFKVKNHFDEEVKMVSTFLKNIEVWQINDRDSRLVTDEESGKISTITVLLTPKQVETMTLAEDVSSRMRVVMANRDDAGSADEEFDFQEAINRQRQAQFEEKVQVATDENSKKEEVDTQKQLIDQMLDASKPKEKQKTEYKHRMTIYRGGQAIKYGFTEKASIPKIIEQSSGNDDDTEANQTETVEDDFSDLSDGVNPEGSPETALN